MIERRLNRYQAGFTLAEAIIAIVITGIVAGIVAVFIAGPIEGYVASVRRAGMTDVADLALRRVAFELRAAVPNTVRVAGAGSFVEFIPASDGGRYRMQGPGNILDSTSAADTSFDVLGPAVSGAAGDFIVIFNTGQPGLDAYEGGVSRNRRTVTATGATVSFTNTTSPFPPFESPAQRFQIVPSTGPVSFGCVAAAAPAGSGGFQLWRYTGYRVGTDNWATQPTAPAVAPLSTGTSALLASDLATCSFDYQAISASNGLLLLRLSVMRENETVSLTHQVHVDNTP